MRQERTNYALAFKGDLAAGRLGWLTRSSRLVSPRGRARRVDDRSTSSVSRRCGRARCRPSRPVGRRVLGRLVAAPERMTSAGLEEHRGLDLERRAPAETLVEGAGGGGVGDTERDEGDALLHRRDRGVPAGRAPWIAAYTNREADPDTSTSRPMAPTRRAQGTRSKAALIRDAVRASYELHRRIHSTAGQAGSTTSQVTSTSSSTAGEVRRHVVLGRVRFRRDDHHSEAVALWADRPRPWLRRT